MAYKSQSQLIKRLFIQSDEIKGIKKD